MTNPLPSLASADRRQREQSAAATPPSQAAASPTPPGLLPIGSALAAIIAGLPVPRDLERQ